jgi:hypothetical protein
MPELSVLMPVRNGAATVERAVTSTLRALPRDSELAVFDDGSTDSTLEVLDRIADPRLVVMSSTGASGVAEALNQLLARTDSRLVGRMDADDVTLPWRFRLQSRMLEGRCRVAFTTVVEWFPATHRLKPNPPRPISVAAFPFRLLLSNPVAHSTTLAERATVTDIGGYRTVPAEDYDLWLRLQAAGVPLACAAVPGILYRVHPGQVTAATGWRSSSWTDERTSQAFAALCRRVLGEPFPRLVALASADGLSPTDFEATLARFDAAFRAASNGLPRVDHSLVIRALDSRLAAVRASFRARVAT